jgi:hypothetical protein
MPTVRKLAPDEVQTIENKGKGLRKITEEQYDGFLAGYDAGEYGEAELSGDEKRLTVRNRLKAAAGRRGVGLNFLRTQGSIIRFKVISGNGQVAKQPTTRKRTPKPEPAPVILDAPPAKRRGGRPKKTST